MNGFWILGPPSHAFLQGVVFLLWRTTNGVVYMGNDNACEITIIDTIQLKTHDESTKILSDVWYVPSMNKCLILIRVL